MTSVLEVLVLEIDVVLLSPDFGQIRRLAVIEMGLKKMHVENI
jgi:hypothetical protein